MTIVNMTDQEQREHFHMSQCISMLRIETSTGLGHSRGSVLKVVQERYGCKKRTKLGALKELEEMFEKRYGRKYGDKAAAS